MQKLSSSLRQRSAEETIELIIADMAPRMGVTRVTDTTWLDRIGIPVFASIRPDASKGSLCVNAGKGLRPAEARIGAYMESIEFSLAEYNKANFNLIRTTPKAIHNSHEGRLEFNQFCMLYGHVADCESAIMAVEVEDILQGKNVLVPAELVFISYLQNPGQRLFGENSSGLASGNDLTEASIHAICELMERDVQALNHLVDRSSLVDMDHCSAEVEELITKITDAGLLLVVRHTENCFNLPYFQAFIMETSTEAPISIASGSGFHPVKEIALIRAITEAAQSRLSHIHGGRDDIIDRVKYFAREGRSAEVDATARLRALVMEDASAVTYTSIICQGGDIHTIEDAWKLLIQRLRENSFTTVLRATFTKPSDAVSVVRIIIPGLESFEPALKRVGPRLIEYVKENA